MFFSTTCVLSVSPLWKRTRENFLPLNVSASMRYLSSRLERVPSIDSIRKQALKVKLDPTDAIVTSSPPSKTNRKSDSPNFVRVREQVTAGRTGVDALQVLFGFDASHEADDRPGTDQKDAIVVVSADQQVRIVVLVQVQSAAQRIAERGRRQTGKVFRSQDLRQSRQMDLIELRFAKGTK